MPEARPSETAMLVALRRLEASFVPALRPLLADPDEPYTGWFLERHSARARRQVERLRAATDGRVRRRLQHAALQPGPLFILLRKRFVEDEVRAAIADGATQVVVLGAGYDALATRLALRFPRLGFYELDSPATLTVKRAALEARNAVPSSLHLLPVDFSRESAEETLRGAPGFRAGTRTVFVAEGVLLYLEPAGVDAVFALARRLGAAHSRFIFTALTNRAVDGSVPSVALAVRRLAQIGTPVKSTLDPQDLSAFLEGRGFVHRATADHVVLRARYLAPLGLAEAALDECTYIALADRREDHA